MFLNTNMVRVSSASLLRAFSVSVDQISSVYTAYLLCYALVMPVAGQLGDTFGRRKIFKTGIFLFAVGSLLSGLSSKFWFLILARAVQGTGGALVFPNALVLATRLSPPEESGKVVGWWGSVASLGAVVGPTIGGILIHYFSWRFIFYANLPISLFILATERMLPDESKECLSDSIPYQSLVGTAFLGAASLCVVVLVRNLGSLQRNAGVTSSMVLTCAACTAVFLRTECRSNQPLLDIAIFGSRAVATSLVCGMVHMFTDQSAMFLMPLLLEKIRGFGPAQVGVAMLPASLGRLLSAPLAGRHADRKGNRIPAVLGLLLMASGCLSFCLIKQDTGIHYILGGLALLGLGDGLVWSSNLTTLLKYVPPEKSGSATGVFNLASFISGIIGTTATGSMINSAIQLNIYPFTGVDTAPGYAASCALLASVTFLGASFGFSCLPRGLSVTQYDAAKRKTIETAGRDAY